MAKPSWFAARRLQSQLLLWTAIIMIASVSITLEMRMRSNIRLLEQALRERSEQLIMAVERSVLPGLKEPFLRDVVEQRLREFVEADRTLTRLDIVERRDAGNMMVASSFRMPELLPLDVPPGQNTAIRTVGNERMMVATLAVEGTNYGIIAVSSLSNIDRYEAFNRSQNPLFAAVLILIVISLMHVMFKRIVSKRFDELLAGIQRARTGEEAQIADDRVDEIGVIAKTLNGLLTQVRSFSDDLKQRVAIATEDLNKRNVALEEATRQMLDMQQQLLDSERLATVGQMAATFAHEIGSPMSSLSAHVQLLLEDERLTDEQRETLGLIRQQINSMVQIVNDLLQSARRSPSDFVLTDINAILRTVLRLVQAKLMAQKIEASVTLETIPLVRGYPLYLQEAFLNVIDNAYDAMPDGGRMEVKTWFDPKTHLVNIRISDTGPGIDAHVVEKMFEHFVTTKAIGRGTGLGLGIVKEIVDSHRGTFNIAANNGRGTAAHITFPVETTSVLAS
jgi:signal transduction histidine kinase